MDKTEKGGVKLKQTRKGMRSLSSTINTIYVTMILLFLLVTGSVLFTVAGQQVNQNVEGTIDSLMSQKSDHLAALYQDIFEKFYALTKSTSSRNLLSDTPSTSETYLDFTEEVEDFYYRNAAFVDSIYVNIDDTYEVTLSEQQVIEDSDQALALFHPDVPSREGYFWLNNHTDQIFSRHQEVQTMVYYEADESDEPTSIFVVNLKTAYIDMVLTELSMDDSYMMILSPEAAYIPKVAPADDVLNDKLYALYQEDELHPVTAEKMIQSHNVRNQQIGTNKWELVLIAPEQTLFTAVNNIWLLFILLFFILVVTIMIIVQVIKKNISNPVEELASQMKTTESYDEKIDPPNDVPRELAVLYETYNNLTDRNTRLVDQMESEQEEKLELELALLHAQIDPHFLYNTLYAIKGLVDMNMKEAASEMVMSLSDFLRTSLSRGKEIITIEEELKNIRSYLYMMNMRYGDYFDYVIEVPEALWSYHIVKLTLQPLVENAIYHGVMSTREKSLITIGGEKVGDDIVIYVEDNGTGMSREKLENIQAEIAQPYISGTKESTGIGLRSVDVRVKNRYGQSYGLEITSVENEYTRMSVKLPKIEGDKDNV